MIACLVITHERLDYLKECVASLHANLTGPISERWMFDDSGSEEHRAELRELFPEFTHINAGPPKGFGGAIRAAWAHLREHSAADYIAHVEQDFVFNREIPLHHMAGVLASNKDIVQLVLRRQPCNESERAAGGIVEQHPDDYDEAWVWDNTNRMWCHCEGGCAYHGREDPRMYPVLLHRRFFSTNPCLYRRELILKNDWPKGDQSEGRFGIGLCRSPKVRFAFWGSRDSGEWVTHIGHDRVAGFGY